MKKILATLLVATMLFVFTGCDENQNHFKRNEDSIENELNISNEFVGTWYVVEGGDEHEVIFEENGDMYMVDVDKIKVEYSVLSSNKIKLIPDEDNDIDEYIFLLKNGQLIRNPGGDDVYIYEK